MIEDLENASPLVSAFVRGFMEKTDEDMKLRACGEAGKEEAESLGFAMSSAYISRVTKNMVKWGVIEKVRDGRHYVVTPGPYFDEVRSFIKENEGWGTSKFKPGEFEDRAKGSRIISQDKGVMFGATEKRIPRGGWAVLQAAFKRGELMCAYVPKGARLVMVLDDEDGNRVKTQLRSWDRTETEEA